ncbi:MAG: ribosomal protein S18-alanine N-acetyltransferase [Clostridiales bacterium]|jgi:ribosomal-protein-alanine N-acetyltransferase|nr:ribosomal protein S18-alanine N-acetyltransferase [Clostridiales bacterium]
MSGEITVRPASADELPAILAIEDASFTCPWSEESFREAFEAENIAIYAAHRDGVLVGFSCLLAIGEEAEILNIASSPAVRRSGVGQALLSRMIGEAAAKGVTELYLEVRDSNAAARSLYRKNGFTEIGIRRHYYIKPREDAILMKKTLVPADKGLL